MSLRRSCRSLVSALVVMNGAGCVDSPTCDSDGDGYDALSCGGTDCDDAGAATHPGAEETCGDGIDQDCRPRSPGCGLVGELDVVDAPVLIRGELYEELGRVVQFLDADGDGLDDVLVGRHNYGTSTPEVLVFLSPLPPGELTPADADARIMGFELPTYQMTLGRADVDGDGFDDLLFGSPTWPTGGPTSGSVLVFPGPLTQDMWPEDAVAEIRGGDWTETGHTLAGLGDLDGDGPDEILVAGRTGPIGLFHGPLSGLLRIEDAETVIERVNSDPSGAAGPIDSVVGIGDFNGDGETDIVIGSHDYHDARGQTPGEFDCGGAALLFLGPFGPAYELGDADVVIASDCRDPERTAAGGAGIRVAAAGDWDGDGLDDVLVGAPAGPGNGLFVHLGSRDPQPFRSVREDAAFRVGRRAGRNSYAFFFAAGDVDGDGRPDVLVRVGEDGIAASLFYGSRTGAADPMSADLLFSADEDYMAAGTTMAMDGDVDGDGRSDILLGDPAWPDAGAWPDPEGAGMVALFLGAPTE